MAERFEGGMGISMEPDDEYNRSLISQVHPPDWQNPDSDEPYHLVVIGAGTAGLVTAAIAAALGARVAMIERRWMGGDCLNVGCVPSKALIEASRSWSAARRSAERFGGPPVAGDGDFAFVMERMRKIRSEISHHDSAERFRELGVDVYMGDAEFTSGGKVRVGDSELAYRRAVIAAGSRPAIPPIPGLDSVAFLTNESVFELTRLPMRMAVIGGGPIGCEIAQAFAGFGTEVAIIESEATLLPREDPDASAVVVDALRRDGVATHTGATVARISDEDGTKRITIDKSGREEVLDVDEVLVATGRTPNVDGLGLDKVGVEADPKKGIVVDDRLTTTNSHIYAIGDIASRFQFTHVADAHARLIVRNALFFGRGKASDLVIPWCTYTTPELAHVGISAKEAAEQGADTLTVPFSDVDRARLDGSDEGFVRVHLQKGSDTILAATVVGEGAGDLISFFTHAMKSGTGVGKFSETIFPYPTRAEVIRKVADLFNRGRLTPTARKAMDMYFRVVG